MAREATYGCSTANPLHNVPLIRRFPRWLSQGTFDPMGNTYPVTREPQASTGESPARSGGGDAFSLLVCSPVLHTPPPPVRFGRYAVVPGQGHRRPRPPHTPRKGDHGPTNGLGADVGPHSPDIGGDRGPRDHHPPPPRRDNGNEQGLLSPTGPLLHLTVLPLHGPDDDTQAAHTTPGHRSHRANPREARPVPPRLPRQSVQGPPAALTADARPPHATGRSPRRLHQPHRMPRSGRFSTRSMKREEETRRD